MRKQVVALVIKAVLLSSVLSGCNTIEHRSEAIPKKPLPEVPGDSKIKALTLTALAPFSKNTPPVTPRLVEPKLVWSTAKGVGTKKSDAKLRLALTQNAVITADTSGVIRAQDRRTGAQLWEKNIKTSISGGPTIIGETLLIGSRSKGVFAYHAGNGDFLWQTPLTGEILACPAGNRGVAFVHSLDGSVTALNLNDGQILWRQGLSTPPIVLRHSSSPAVADNQVFVGFANGRLMALHRLDGSQNWEREIAIPKGRSDIQRMTDISADPLVKDGVVYVVSYQGRLAALKADSGVPLWEREMSSYSGFALDKNILYLADAKGSLIALSRRTGKTIWEQDALQGRRLSKPEIHNGLLVVGDDDGYLHWISAKDGSLLNRILVDSQGIETPPISDHNSLYVLGRGGKLSVFNASFEVANNTKPGKQTETDNTNTDNTNNTNMESNHSSAVGMEG